MKLRLFFVLVILALSACSAQESAKDAYYRGMRDMCENSYVVNAQTGERVKVDTSKIYPGGCDGLIVMLRAQNFYERHTK